MLACGAPVLVGFDEGSLVASWSGDTAASNNDSDNIIFGLCRYMVPLARKGDKIPDVGDFPRKYVV